MVRPAKAVSLRQRALSGGTVSGVMIFEFFTPGIARIAKNAGAEFVLYDMEHGGLSLEQFKVQAAIASGIGIAPWLRVPRGDYHFLARALDLGAHGVMVPMVESAAEAASLVEACRYPPTGRRGAAFGFAHDGYAAADPVRTMPDMDARTFVIAQIETERGLAEVDAIAATPGIDCLWVGHFDLTNFLGIPGQFQHQRFTDALDAIVAAGRRHKKALAILVSEPQAARVYKSRGFHVQATGTEMFLLTTAMRSVLDAMR